MDWKVLVGLMLISFAAAKPITGGMDEDCIANGYDFGIEKFNLDDVYELEDDNPSYDITVEGNAIEATWTSEPSVAGVVMKSGNDYYGFEGGSSGTVTSQGKDISHITFCGQNEVPEFGLVGGLLALLGGILVLALRK